MSIVSEIYSVLNQIAPFQLTMDFDNTGILVGNRFQPVSHCLLALDCTEEIVQQAISSNAQLIITHHPIIFHPLKRINEDCVVYRLIQHNIAVISAHTNLDLAPGGVNDALAARLGLCQCVGLEAVNPEQNIYLGRVGMLEQPMTADAFAKTAKEKLNAASVKFSDCQKMIQKVAVCSGSGGDCISAAVRHNADALLTADVKHNQFLDAVSAGISLFDAGHFDTEDVIIEPLCRLLSEQIPNVSFSTSHQSSIQAI